MNPEQRQRYADRIEKVVRFMQTNQAAEASLSDLAKIASMSEFHFHRVYRLMTGEPAGETLRRLRLARAVPALAQGKSVAHAAGDSNYATPQALARAMRAQTGLSPTQSQAHPQLLQDCLRRARPVIAREMEPPALTIDIVSTEPLRLLAVRNVGAYSELNATYNDLFERVCRQFSPEQITGIYGVWFDDPRETPDEQCRAVCAFDAGGQGEALDGLEIFLLPAQRCARIRHRGDYVGIWETLDVLYAQVLCQESAMISEAIAWVHYLDDPDNTPVDQLRADAYLPLA